MGYYTNTYCDRYGNTLKIVPQEYFVPIGQYSYVSKEMEEKLIPGMDRE